MSNDALASVEIFGVPLVYERRGIGSPLVLIHEGIGDLRMFNLQIDAFAQRHEVIRYDLHGFGESGKPQIPFSHHEALKQLLDHLGIERTALLGMSIGGQVAVDFTLTYPDHVQAIVLAAAGLDDNAPPDEETMRLVQPLIEASNAKDYARLNEAEIHLWVDGPKRTPGQVDPAVRQLMLELNAGDLRRSLEPGPDPTPLDPPAITRLGEIAIPTLVIVGDGDVPGIVRQADLLANSIPGARKVVFPDVAHVPNLERPEAFNRAVLDFLNER